MDPLLNDFDLFVAALPLLPEDESMIEEERQYLETILAHSDAGAVLYLHYLQLWLTIFFEGITGPGGHCNRGDAIAWAVDQWDEGFYAAPDDWVTIPSALKLAWEGCRSAWTHAWQGPVLPIPPFGFLLSDLPYLE